MMKVLSKIGVFCVLFLALAAGAGAQAEWAGSYEFGEDGGKTRGGTAVYISHQLEIRQTDDGLVAYLKSNGFQTSKDLICTAKAEGSKLLVYFEGYGEDNVFEPYEIGDLLLTLEAKTAKGKTEILTYWGKFLPVVPKNEKTGQVYFRKLVPVRESREK